MCKYNTYQEYFLQHLALSEFTSRLVAVRSQILHDLERRETGARAIVDLAGASGKADWLDHREARQISILYRPSIQIRQWKSDRYY